MNYPNAVNKCLFVDFGVYRSFILVQSAGDCGFWLDQQISVCYPKAISRCLCQFKCDQQAYV